MLKLNRFLIICAVALTVNGCALLPKPVQDFVAFATATVENPAKPVNIYQAKLVYDSTLDAANAWREFCFGPPGGPTKSYRVLMQDPVGKFACASRRPVLRTVQKADDIAFAALIRAETFIRDNPTLDASKVVREAIAAVVSFRDVAKGQASQAIAAAK